MRWAEGGWVDGPVGQALRCEGWANTSCLPRDTPHWAATTGHRLVRFVFMFVSMFVFMFVFVFV